MTFTPVLPDSGACNESLKGDRDDLSRGSGRVRLHPTQQAAGLAGPQGPNVGRVPDSGSARSRDWNTVPRGLAQSAEVGSVPADAAPEEIESDARNGPAYAREATVCSGAALC